MATRSLAALGVLVAACLGLAGCSGDGDVVLPSDTKPKPTPTTTTSLSCAEARATATSRRLPDGSVEIPLIACG